MSPPSPHYNYYSHGLSITRKVGKYQQNDSSPSCMACLSFSSSCSDLCFPRVGGYDFLPFSIVGHHYGLTIAQTSPAPDIVCPRCFGSASSSFACYLCFHENPLKISSSNYMTEVLKFPFLDSFSQYPLSFLAIPNINFMLNILLCFTKRSLTEIKSSQLSHNFNFYGRMNVNSKLEGWVMLLNVL